MDRREYLRLGGVAVAALAGCGAGGPRTVRMTDDLRFDPERVRIQAGATVEWTNPGSVSHTVTADGNRIPPDAAYFASGGFDSEATARENLEEGLVAPGESYTHTFDGVGTYEYFCIPHEGSGMTGTVRVG